MAALQYRNGVYRLILWHNQRHHSLNIGPVPLSEAKAWKGRAEHLLMRVEQRLLEVPAGISIAALRKSRRFQFITALSRFWLV